MRVKNASVLGPYRNGDKWRVVLIEDAGRTAKLCATLEEAEQLKATLQQHFQDRSRILLSDALAEYIAEKERNGAMPATVRTLRAKLGQFLPDNYTLGELSPAVAARLYQHETERQGKFGRIKAATHRNLLRSAKCFFTWAVGRGYVRENPFAAVKPVGKIHTGKQQLRLEEARRFSSHLLEHAPADQAALAILVQITMGLRSSEVLRIRVRDVDNGGAVLWVDGTKTRSSKRVLNVESEPLRRLLAEKAASRTPSELLFGEVSGEPHGHGYLWKAVRRYCQSAGVPRVCPHSLRGLHSTLAVERGGSSRLVADALGHSSPEITHRHYIDGDRAKNASVQRVTQELGLGSASPGPAPDLAALAQALRALSAEQLAALLQQVGRG